MNFARKLWTSPDGVDCMKTWTLYLKYGLQPAETMDGSSRWR